MHVENVSVSVYCAGCRRKLAEGDGKTFKLKCPNCKTMNSVEIGARLPKIADKIATLAAADLSEPKSS